MMGFSADLDLYPLLAAVLAAVSCGLLGNFLVLRRLSLMGDAISHSVLPGLVIAFLITSERSSLVMFAGAATAGIATVVLVELVKKLGRVEPGAAMGVVFSVLFALGVLLIERAAVRHVDLDADCVLYGQLENLWQSPRQVITLAVTTLLAFAFVGVFFKELRIAAFDPAIATAQGFSATLMHYLLMILVAVATVASFEAVGSILVIAMLVCPAATARLLTDRLLPQLAWSVVIAIVSAVGGYVGASAVPALFEKDAVNAAGAMAVTAGVLLAAAIVFSPRHGLVTRAVRRRRLARRVALDDLLAALYRAKETGAGAVKTASLESLLAGRPLAGAIVAAEKNEHITRDNTALSLTPAGERIAAEIVRRHRLWEHYLVGEAGVAPDHVHAPAEQLEHLPAAPPPGPTADPHGREIPPSAD